MVDVCYIEIDLGRVTSNLDVAFATMSDFEWLPIQPNCNVSHCSRGNIFIPVTFSKAGLMKVLVLSVSIMMYALHLLTFVLIVVHWHISVPIRGCVPSSDVSAVFLVCIAYWNVHVPLEFFSFPIV